jgi:hypothetical protein
VNVEAERWWLVTQLPPTDPGRKTDLEILCEVDADEACETREANALLARLAGVAPYARLVELYEELVEALGRDASAKHRAAQMTATHARSGRSHRSCPRISAATLQPISAPELTKCSGSRRRLPRRRRGRRFAFWPR